MLHDQQTIAGVYPHAAIPSCIDSCAPAEILKKLLISHIQQLRSSIS
jgi:hypothetical protein